MALTESDIKIIIAAEFRKQGFDKASRASTQLEKGLKKVGYAAAAAFSVQRIQQFANESVKAFLEDDKAATKLTQTLKNLGLGFEDPRVKTFISTLEQTSGILDDELRPAFQALLTTTRDVTVAQGLMNVAIDTARGSGKDLATVAQDLANAYVGNYKGLKKYNLGLTQAELSAKSFEEIVDLLNKQFAGQNAAYLKTYAGKVDQLKVAYANMQETIGKGLVDSFALLAGDGGIGAATKAMGEFSQKISDAIYGASSLISDLTSALPNIGEDSFIGFFMKHGGALQLAIDLLAKYGKSKKQAAEFAAFDPEADARKRRADRIAAAEAEKNANAEKKRRAALIAAEKKRAADRLRQEREAQQLKRAGTVFDMENIQIVAALQGKISEEQRLRLVALLAINNQVADAAEKLSNSILALQSPSLKNLGIIVDTSDNATTVINKMIMAQTNLALINSGIKEIPYAKNPFESWNEVMKTIIDNLDKIALKIKQMPSATTPTAGGAAATATTAAAAATAATGVTTVITPDGTVAGIPTNVPFGDTFKLGDFSMKTSPETYIADLIRYSNPSHLPAYAGTSLTSPANVLASARYDLMQTTIENQIKADMQRTNDLAAARYTAMQAYYTGQTQPTVVVNVAGNVTTERDLVTAVTDSLYQFQKNGGQVQLSSLAI